MALTEIKCGMLRIYRILPERLVQRQKLFAFSVAIKTSSSIPGRIRKRLVHWKVGISVRMPNLSTATFGVLRGSEKKKQEVANEPGGFAMVFDFLRRNHGRAPLRCTRLRIKRKAHAICPRRNAPA